MHMWCHVCVHGYLCPEVSMHIHVCKPQAVCVRARVLCVRVGTSAQG